MTENDAARLLAEYVGVLKAARVCLGAHRDLEEVGEVRGDLCDRAVELAAEARIMRDRIVAAMQTGSAANFTPASGTPATAPPPASAATASGPTRPPAAPSAG